MWWPQRNSSFHHSLSKERNIHILRDRVRYSVAILVIATGVVLPEAVLRPGPQTDDREAYRGGGLVVSPMGLTGLEPALR